MYSVYGTARNALVIGPEHDDVVWHFQTLVVVALDLLVCDAKTASVGMHSGRRLQHDSHSVQTWGMVVTSDVLNTSASRLRWSATTFCRSWMGFEPDIGAAA